MQPRTVSLRARPFQPDVPLSQAVLWGCSPRPTVPIGSPPTAQYPPCSLILNVHRRTQEIRQHIVVQRAFRTCSNARHSYALPRGLAMKVHNSCPCSLTLHVDFTTSEKIPSRCLPMGSSNQSSELFSSPTLRIISSCGHRDMPSADTFCAPGICLVVRVHPPMVSRRPSILINGPGL